MTKDLIRLAFITLPIVVIIALVRVNYSLDLVIDNRSLDHNYVAVGTMIGMFSLVWLVNIPLVSLIDKPRKRYAVSFAVMTSIIILLINVHSEHVFGADEQFLVHPFWMGLVFNTAVIALINFTILKTDKNAAILRVNELKALKLEAEKKLLVQQLQPHFLFNALSTLKSLINEDPATASDYTVKLSEFLRYTVASSKNDIVTVKSELDFTKDYIKLQSERFLDAVVSKINVPAEVLLLKLPVFSLQTLVENAFKHNQFSKEQPLLIDISYADGYIVVSNVKHKSKVTDPSSSTGTGLQNLNERYRIIANTDVIIEDLSTTFTVKLKPIEI